MKGEALTIDEVVARALESIVDTVPMIDASQSQLRRVRAESLARSALAAIKAAGFVVVPREPSRAMRNAAAGEIYGIGHLTSGDCERIARAAFTAMLAAAEGEKP